MPVLFMRRLSRGADRLHIVLNSRLFEHVEAMSPDGLDCNVPDDCDLFEALAGNQPPNGDTRFSRDLLQTTCGESQNRLNCRHGDTG